MTRKLDAGKLVREKARKLLGPVPPARVIPDKRKKPEKHKVNYLRQAGEGPPDRFWSPGNGPRPPLGAQPSRLPV